MANAKTTSNSQPSLLYKVVNTNEPIIDPDTKQIKEEPCDPYKASDGTIRRTRKLYDEDKYTDNVIFRFNTSDKSVAPKTLSAEHMKAMLQYNEKLNLKADSEYTLISVRDCTNTVDDEKHIGIRCLYKPKWDRPDLSGFTSFDALLG